MRFEFEHEASEGSWNCIGTSDGSGEDAIGEALDKLSAQQGGLPAGRYRYRPEAQEAGWAHLRLKADGRHELVDFP